MRRRSKMQKEKNVFGEAKYVKAQNSPQTYSLYDPAPFFRKEFILSGIKTARIYVQSPGFARYYINGKPITDDLFISAVSDYRKILWYNEYDVTALLHSGKNVVCVIAGNGFLNESFKSAWDFDKVTWRDAPQFCLRLTVNGKTALVSDGSWKCSRENSYIVFNHLRSGEYWDMRKKCDAWLSSGYDDSEWQSVILRSAPLTAEFRPINCQPIREFDCVKPERIIKTERGYLLDYGVNRSGYIKACVSEERGREISFFYTEEVDENNNPKYNGMDAVRFYPESPFQLNKMIASGGTDVFKPKFSYHGFRYVLISGLTAEPEAAAFLAYFTHQDVARRSDFYSGNDVLNFIYRAGIRSSLSNLFWCLTDCPTREKLGWANDAQYSAEQLLINFDIYPLFEKWFEDLLSCMREDGSLPGIIPSPDWGYDWGPVCDFLLFEIPYRSYLYTGRTQMLTEAIPYFKRYIKYLTEQVDAGHEFILGDWLGYENSPLTPKEFVRDYYLLRALKTANFASRLSGREDADIERQLVERKRSFIRKYLDEKGRCKINSQCAVSMMLAEGLYDRRTVIAKQLIKIVIKDDYTLTCGMVGVQYVYRALTEAGRADIAYRLITESEPGYKTWLNNGATTLWERWDGVNVESHNHHMYSGVTAWFFRSLLGIAPKETRPAFEEIELCPRFIEAAGYVRGSMKTIRGTISAEWRFENGGFTYKVVIPKGVSATFRGKVLTTGENTFFVK